MPKKAPRSAPNQKKISTDLMVALIGLVGTLGVAIFGYMSTRSEILLPIRVTQTFDAKQTLVANITQPTQSATPTLASSPSTTPTITSNSATNPTPQIVSLLPQAQKAIVQKAAETLIQAAQALPLVVKDDFDNNDYGWPEADNIYTGGIECNTAIMDGAYVMNIHTANGPAFCFAGIAKEAKDFIISVEQRIINKTNSDIFIYYRLSSEGSNFYDIGYNPQTQIFSAGITKDSQFRTIVGATYVEEINTSGANKITLLALGSSHVVYINDKLITIFTDDQLQEGQFRFTIQLQEAHKEESLLIDHFDLRGD